MSDHVQIYVRRVRVEKLERGAQPVFELALPENERVIQIDHFTLDYARRKTVDHVADIWIEARLRPLPHLQAVTGQPQRE